MSGSIPSKAIAACFSLACFSVAVFAGLSADRSASSILGDALLALVIGQAVGWIAALMIQHVFDHPSAASIPSHDSDGASRRADEAISRVGGPST